MRIGIIGYGIVGKALHALFSRNQNNAVAVYDKFLATHAGRANRAAIDECDVAFVCVPTPSADDGVSCDITAVEEVLSWVRVPVCIKSTVPPGTVDRLALRSEIPIAFSPEFVGETAWHPWKDIENHGFVIVGGPREVRTLVITAYQSCRGPQARYYQTDALTAELCKYMGNCFLATKVAFVNQFYDIAESLGVDFNELRELWLADERIGRSHTMVTEERGFRGRCLPKDMLAMVALMQRFGGAPLLEAVVAYNSEVCQRAGERAKPQQQSAAAAAK